MAFSSSLSFVKRRAASLSVLAGFLISAVSLARAEVKPNALFSDNAVLQAGMEVPVWGTARDGETVSVEFADQKVTTTVKDGKWSVRALVYGEKIEYSGPIFDAMKIDGTRAVLSFKHLGGGLVAKDGDLKGFEIAGPGKKAAFLPAKAKIQGDAVVVSSEQVAQPAAVRFGWANVPDVNFYNQAGLPASPFRTNSN